MFLPIFRWSQPGRISTLVGSILSLVLLTASLAAQTPEIVDGAELQQALDKLMVLGSVMYVAAHPDDENTALLACWSRGRGLRTAYLALTRGGGGQNLLGNEFGVRLAILRTQELLAARRIDGAEQYFTRALDFGYSKTPEESLAIWGREGVLSDMVWVIRRFRPDVIVTRFPRSGGGHGHHTASAILAEEAFRAAGDPRRFPEQLKTVTPWQPRRIVWNAWRFDRGEVGVDVSRLVSVDVGAYDPLLGRSFTELAAESRSMHRSQGFGVIARRGSHLEYFQPVDGSVAERDLFEGINTTWGRVPGSEAVVGHLEKAVSGFRPDHPAAILPELLGALTEMDRLPDNGWVRVKRQELLRVIRACTGLWLEAVAERATVVPGTTLQVTLTGINRSPIPITLRRVIISNPALTRRVNAGLADNEPWTGKLELTLPDAFPISRHYWLKQPPSRGDYRIADSPWRGDPEAPPPLQVEFELEMNGHVLTYTIPVVYRWRDPVLGERYRYVSVVPAVMVNMDETVEMFPDNQARDVRMTLVAGTAGVTGRMRVQVPDGWRVEPAGIDFSLDKPMAEREVVVRVRPPAKPTAGRLTVTVDNDGHPLHWGFEQIDYPHINPQVYFPPAELRLVRMDLRMKGTRLGYVMGAGDGVPQCLTRLGYTVTLLDDSALEEGDLSGYDAIITGIRAYNTRDRLRVVQPRLLAYVAAGGTLIVQYNVNRGLVTEAIGPYPFHISRERVTDESAAVTLSPGASGVLKAPNRIDAPDFDGWVQERGLYFADEWDPRYQTPLSMADPGEKPLTGSLLVTSYGKGYFVYTGLAFFRQLPAGVPGAYRLFANLIALGRAP